MLTVKCSPALYRVALARHESHSGETASVHTQEAKPATISKIERHISEFPNKSRCAAL